MCYETAEQQAYVLSHLGSVPCVFKTVEAFI